MPTKRNTHNEGMCQYIRSYTKRLNLVLFLLHESVQFSTNAGILCFVLLTLDDLEVADG